MCQDGGLFHLPCDIALADVQLAQMHDTLRGASVAQAADCAAYRRTISLLAEFLFLSQANQQHAFGRDIGNPVQEQDRAGSPVHVATTDNPGKICL